MSPGFPRKVYIEWYKRDSGCTTRDLGLTCQRCRSCLLKVTAVQIYLCHSRQRAQQESFPSAIEHSRVPGCDTLASPSLTIFSLCSSSKPTSRRTSPAATSRWDSCESAQATAPAHFSRQALRVAVNKLKENPDLVARKACPPPMTGFIACNCSMWSKRGNDLPYFVLLPPPGFYVLRT